MINKLDLYYGKVIFKMDFRCLDSGAISVLFSTAFNASYNFLYSPLNASLSNSPNL